MKLLILRHGEAVEAAEVGGRDQARTLTRRGRRVIGQVAAALRAWELRPATIWSSRWARAWETAGIVAKALGDLEIQAQPALEAPRDVESMLKCLDAASKLPSLLLVGHNPSLEELAGCLVSDSGQAAIKLKKGGLAILEIAGPIGPGCGVLEALWAPGALKALADAGKTKGERGVKPGIRKAKSVGRATGAGITKAGL